MKCSTSLHLSWFCATPPLFGDCILHSKSTYFRDPTPQIYPDLKHSDHAALALLSACCQYLSVNAHMETSLHIEGDARCFIPKITFGIPFCGTRAPWSSSLHRPWPRHRVGLPCGCPHPMMCRSVLRCYHHSCVLAPSSFQEIVSREFLPVHHQIPRSSRGWGTEPTAPSDQLQAQNSPTIASRPLSFWTMFSSKGVSASAFLGKTSVLVYKKKHGKPMDLPSVSKGLCAARWNASLINWCWESSERQRGISELASWPSFRRSK